MAGTILINEKQGLATSTVDFDYFAEKIRIAFLLEHGATRDAVYEPFDEGGMTFISAADLNAKEFQIFAHTVNGAYAVAVEESSIKSHNDQWVELLKLMESDPRYQVIY